MKAVYSDAHRLHRPGDVVENGIVRQSRDVPERLDALLRAVRRSGHEIVAAHDHGMEPLSAVHSARYLDFLSTAFADWTRAGLGGRVFPATFDACPQIYRTGWSVVAKAGHYLRDQLTPVDEDTWHAAYWAAQAVLTAASLIRNGETRAYALCRPSGHHAGRDFGAGATYLNNAAIAARFLARDMRLVAVIDIDVHHGNGTQDIFWDDDRVFFASVHRSPAAYYPHFTGFADETGGASAKGGNLNHPLPAGSGDNAYVDGILKCLAAGLQHEPAALVVSLGFDALVSDPAKGLLVTENAFERIGAMLGPLSIPILLVQEGGYDLANLENVANRFLAGLLRSSANLHQK